MTRKRLPAGRLFLLVSCALLLSRTVSAAPGDGPAEPGRLRARAMFSAGRAELDFGPGELRLSRIWWGRDYNRSPLDGSRGRTALGDCLVPGPREGIGAFEPRTDAALRGLGVLNARSGTFAFRVRRGEVFSEGGIIFSGKSFVAGGPSGGIHWALGIGGRGSLVPAGFLFVETGSSACVADRPMPAGEWVHVAATWDEDAGARLYLDGQPAGSSRPGPGATGRLLPGYGRYTHGLVHDLLPVPVERIHIHPNPGIALSEIHVFDAPLVAGEIAALARGDSFDPGRLPLALESPVDRARRFRLLGWGEGLDGDLVSLAPGRRLKVREYPAAAAFEDLRAAGSIAVDGMPFTFSPWPYHGYAFSDPRLVRLEFSGPVEADYLVAGGNLSGRLRAGGTRQDPFSGEDFLDLPGYPPVFRKHLEKPFSAASATVVRESGQVSGLHLYRLSEGDHLAAMPGRDFSLGGPPVSGLPLGEFKRQEFVTSYGHLDRAFTVAGPGPAGEAARRRLPALRAHHLFTRPMEADFPLAGIRLRLVLEGVVEPTRLQLRVHDPFDPWRELARLDFRLEPAPGAGGAYEVTLRLRETLLAAGSAAWVSLTPENDLELVLRDSSIRLLEAEKEVASRNFLEWELAGWRNAFESLSEPRPWSGIGDHQSGWWLRAASPEYEHMVRVGRELLGRYPEDGRVRSWFDFIHPRQPNPAADLPLPETGGHPLWAVLARENLRLYAEFVDWWTENRHDGTGQFGNWTGDDTVLLQDWADLALVDDPGGRLRAPVRALADGVYRWHVRGRPFMVEGLNSRWTDGLHAYEDGLNMQPMAFLLDYGNPVLFHRLMETASRYDGFLLTGAENGERRFNSRGTGRPFFNTDRAPEGNPLGHEFFLSTHAGQVLVWYNGSAKVTRMFSELAAWLIRSREEGAPVTLRNGGWDLMAALRSRLGDEPYLGQLLDLETVRESGILPVVEAPSLARRLPEGLFDATASLEVLRENAPERFSQLGTHSLGWADRRYDSGWMEWFLARDKAYLEEALAALYRHLKHAMPALTVAEQSGDRVSVPKRLISSVYLGGMPAARNTSFYPSFAVSYENLGRDFAALVLEDGDEELKVLFYSFENEPRRGLVRAWNLLPGEYEIIAGPDLSGDDRIDRVTETTRLELVRGDGFEVVIPPGQAYIVRARRTRAGTPLFERADLAVDAGEALFGEDGSLTVPVHNIGAVAAGGVEVELLDAAQAPVARRLLPGLEAPLDLRPRTAAVAFSADEVSRALCPAGMVRVEVDRARSIEEITRRNNRALIPAGAVTRGGPAGN